jgi:hypothetical protein
VSLAEFSVSSDACLYFVVRLILTANRIEVKKTKKDLGEQFRLLVIRRFLINVRNLKRGFYYLTEWTLILLAFATFFSTNFFITLKAILIMMTILAWIVLILFIPFIYVSKIIHFRRANRYVNSLFT